MGPARRGAYAGNTWRPTAAVLRVEAPEHPVMAGLPTRFTSAPNEWYRWEGDLRAHPQIQVLLSIDPASFPLGTGPKPHEIWHRGDYPVVWTHRQYRMLYVNMGHNDLDYEGQTNRERSWTFANEAQNRLLRQGLFWLAQAGSPAEAPAARPRVVAYVPNWIDLAAFAPTIDLARVTHLNVAFENPVHDEGELSFHRGNAALLAAVRARAPQVKVLVSIGGGSAADDQVLRPRYARLLGAERRAAFAARLRAYVEAHGFDGLDVDLEGPAITADYGPFIRELAAAWGGSGRLLTAALSQGYGGARVPAEALQAFDFINIMAYDGAGTWAPDRPGQHSSFAFAQSNLAYWLQRGLPRAKAVLGVPFYGYGFGADFRKRPYSYAEIVARFPGAERSDAAGRTIWYNGLDTIRAKARLARTERIGGVMIWSLDNDGPGATSLLRALDEELRRD